METQPQQCPHKAAASLKDSNLVPIIIALLVVFVTLGELFLVTFLSLKFFIN